MDFDNQQLVYQLETAAHQHGESYDFLDHRLAALTRCLAINPDTLVINSLAAGLVWPSATKSTQPLKATVGLQLQASNEVQIKLPEKLRKQGLIIMDLFEAIRVHPRLIDRFLMTKACQPNYQAQLAVHRAFLNAGIFVYVPARLHLSSPIVLSASYSTAQPLHFHTLVVAERESNVQVRQRLQLPKTGITTAVTEIIAQTDSRVDFQSLSMPQSTRHFIHYAQFCRPGGEVFWH